MIFAVIARLDVLRLLVSATSTDPMVAEKKIARCDDMLMELISSAAVCVALAPMAEKLKDTSSSTMNRREPGPVFTIGNKQSLPKNPWGHDVSKGGVDITGVGVVDRLVVVVLVDFVARSVVGVAIVSRQSSTEPEPLAENVLFGQG